MLCRRSIPICRVAVIAGCRIAVIVGVRARVTVGVSAHRADRQRSRVGAPVATAAWTVAPPAGHINRTVAAIARAGLTESGIAKTGLTESDGAAVEAATEAWRAEAAERVECTDAAEMVQSAPQQKPE